MIDGALWIPDSCSIDGQNVSAPASDLIITPSLPYFIGRPKANGRVHLMNEDSQIL